MKEFLGRIKADFLLSSVLCIALGLVFIIWRASVLTIVANVLAVVLIIIGVVYMCSYFLNIVTNGFSAMLGLVHDGVCKISDSKHYDGLFISDFT